MTTKRQELGDYGEQLVTKICSCPRCKRSKTLKKLIRNFKCADVICDFCSYTAQVKAKSVSNINKIPTIIPGAAWKVQKERMDAGIYNSLFIVLVNEKNWSSFTINYLPNELQSPDMFIKRKKELSEKAQRHGWLGYDIKFTDKHKSLVSKIFPLD